MKHILVLETTRNGYAIDQLGKTMTVGELIDFLSDYHEDTEVYLSNDKGYTFGEVKEYNFREEEEYID